MSYQFYKVTHLVGIFMLLLALGGATLHMAAGGARQFPTRRLIGILHGIGLLVSLVGGFGLLARLAIFNMPPWVIAKIAIWVILGAMPAIIYRKSQLAKTLLATVLVLAGLSAGFAIYKPMFSSGADSTTSESQPAPSDPAAPATTQTPADEEIIEIEYPEN